MNFRFVKLSQNCEPVSKETYGIANLSQNPLTFDGALPSAYTRASSLIANSCRTCDKYLKVLANLSSLTNR